jgi:hypothetical protein
MRNYEIQKERKKNEEQFEIKEEKLNTKETYFVLGKRRVEEKYNYIL